MEGSNCKIARTALSIPAIYMSIQVNELCCSPHSVENGVHGFGLKEDYGGDRPTVRPQKLRPVVWQLITENIYTHRQIKMQDEDDVMLCHCKAPADGGPACGENCINRALNMECVAVRMYTASMPTVAHVTA